jgi:hypothetical protein
MSVPSIEFLQYKIAIKMSDSNIETGHLLVEALFELSREESNELLATEEVKRFLFEGTLI